jgi:hypothetical protein
LCSNCCLNTFISPGGGLLATDYTKTCFISAAISVNRYVHLVRNKMQAWCDLFYILLKLGETVTSSWLFYIAVTIVLPWTVIISWPVKRLSSLQEGLRFVDLVEVDSTFDFVHIYGLFNDAVSRADDLSVCVVRSILWNGELFYWSGINGMGEVINVCLLASQCRDQCIKLRQGSSFHILPSYNSLTVPTLDAVILSGEHMKLGIYDY